MLGTWGVERVARRLGWSDLRFGPDQQGEPWKEKVSTGIVDHIYLAGIKARFERCERHVLLEDGGLALSRI